MGDVQGRMKFPGLAAYIFDFALTGNTYYNGKLLQVSNSTP